MGPPPGQLPTSWYLRDPPAASTRLARPPRPHRSSRKASTAIARSCSRHHSASAPSRMALLPWAGGMYAAAARRSTSCTASAPGHSVSRAPFHSAQRSSTSARRGASRRTLSSSPVPYRCFSSCGEPKQRSWPEHWMAMREQRESASSMECVVRMTALVGRRCAMERITSHMKCRATGSMPAEGSSKNTISGSPIIARAKDSLRLLPPLSWQARECSKLARSTMASFCCTSASMRGPSKPFTWANSSKCSLVVIRSSSASNCGQ
mmetsp:Transcript_91774/g.239252  ORF Transcript_91774/g.239252 Transcript_91774/m.239252 type:complete len:264 (-) Transcript_91774:1679-2470(-)